jgi:hypothetical protein
LDSIRVSLGQEHPLKIRDTRGLLSNEFSLRLGEFSELVNDYWGNPGRASLASEPSFPDAGPCGRLFILFLITRLSGFGSATRMPNADAYSELS